MILDPNRTVTVRTHLIDLQTIRVFEGSDDRWSSIFGQRSPMHDLVGFPFNFVPCHGFAAEPVILQHSTRFDPISIVASIFKIQTAILGRTARTLVMSIMRPFGRCPS